MFGKEEEEREEGKEEENGAERAHCSLERELLEPREGSRDHID